MNWEEGWCPNVTVYEEEQRYSSVLDRNGRPYMLEPNKKPIGFVLKKREEK